MQRCTARQWPVPLRKLWPRRGAHARLRLAAPACTKATDSPRPLRGVSGRKLKLPQGRAAAPRRWRLQNAEPETLGLAATRHTRDALVGSPWGLPPPPATVPSPLRLCLRVAARNPEASRPPTCRNRKWRRHQSAGSRDLDEEMRSVAKDVARSSFHAHPVSRRRTREARNDGDLCRNNCVNLGRAAFMSTSPGAV